MTHIFSSSIERARNLGCIDELGNMAKQLLREKEDLERRLKSLTLFDVYVAGPYSHDDEETMNWRAEQLAKYTAALVKAGYSIYSPIAMTHLIVTITDLGIAIDWETWAHQNEIALSLCKTLHILKLPGWQESIGVNNERIVMVNLGREIVEVEYQDGYTIDS